MAFKYQLNKLHFLLATFIWMLIISSFSSSYFSAGNTAPLVERLLNNISPSLNSSTINSFHIMVRKLAHFTEFGIFATLVFGIFAVKKNVWHLSWLFYSLISVILLALLDEYHQAFVRNRNASLGDSLVDILGGLTYLFLIWLVKRNKFQDIKILKK